MKKPNKPKPKKSSTEVFKGSRRPHSSEDAPANPGAFAQFLDTTNLNGKAKEMIANSMNLLGKESDIAEPFVKAALKTALEDTNADYYQQPLTRHICEHYLTKSQFKEFRRVNPQTALIPSKCPTLHPHPLLNDERSRFERIAYNYIMRHCNNPTIVDIGGNPSRHAKLSRTNVWSCCPILETNDIFRLFHNSGHGVDKLCHHRAQDCQCVHPDAFLTVDAIYYLTPLEIAHLTIRSKANCFVAVHHCFPHAFGAFAAGEATYIALDAETVSMSVNGNKSPYVHSNLAWMNSNHFNFWFEDKPVCLVWSPIQTGIGYHDITVFKVVPYHMTAFKNVSEDFVSAMQTKSYYGDVQMNAFNEKADVSVPGEVLLVDTVNIHSLGSFVVVTSSSVKRPVIAPKHFVTEIAAYCMGRPRDSDTFRNVVSYARHAAKRLNFPPELLTASVHVCACLGFKLFLLDETNNMYSHIKPNLTIAAVHKDAIAMKFRTVYNWKKILAGVMAASAVVATASVPLGAPVVALGAAAVAVAASAGLVSSSPDTSDGFANYRTNRASNHLANRTIHHSKPVHLPPTKPPVPLDELLEKELDPTATLEVIDPLAEKHMPAALVAGGIVSTVSIPVVPTSSTHSSCAALVQRQLKVQPISTDAVVPESIKEMLQYARQNFDDFFPGVRANPIKPNFKMWNSRFKRGLQTIHQRCVESSIVSNSQCENMRGMFVKIEGSAKSDTEGVDKFVCRPIQSAQSSHNVKTGPFMLAVSECMKTRWNVCHDVGLVYTSGVDAVDIGDYFSSTLQNPCDKIIEGDYNRFDASIHAGLLRLEIDFYRMMGADESVLNSLEQSIHTFGRDKFGNTYTVFGTRHSGDANTSCGNTMLQGICLTYALATQIRENDGSLPVPSTVWKKLNVRALLLGDDSLLSVSTTVDPLAYAITLRELGLDLDPHVRTGPNKLWESTFCSSRFYPVVDKYKTPHVVLGPPIGRVLAKAGYFSQPPPGMNVIQLVRGDALSRLQSSHFIPFLRNYWKRVIQLTSHVSARFTKAMIDHLMYQFSTADKFEPSDETWAMLSHVYKLERSDEVAYQFVLNNINSVPCTSDNTMFATAFAVDAVTPDSLNTLPKPDHLEPSHIPMEPMPTTAVTVHEQKERFAGVPDVIRRPRPFDHFDPDIHYIDVFSNEERPNWTLYR